MAIVEAVSLLLSAVSEAASVVWMELSMFSAAALLYVLYVGVAPKRAATGKGTRKKVPAPSKAAVASERPAVTESQRAALRLWEKACSADEVPQVDIAVVVDAMQKTGKTVSEVTSQLRKAVDSNSKLLPLVAGLPTALLRDDAVELLDATLMLLEDKEQTIDVSLYAGLMAAQLRRRDYAAVSATAARQGSGELTPRMRGMLAASAAFRGLLDEALGHLRQVPEPVEGSKPTMQPSAVAQLLLLALREERVTAAAQELQRVGARVDHRQFDDLFSAEGWNRTPAACQELLDAGATLSVSLGPSAYRSLAVAVTHAGDKPKFVELLEKLEGEVEKDGGVCVNDPLAVALMCAARAVRDGDAVSRILELHRGACTGAPSNKVLYAACMVLLVCDRKEAACDLYEKHLISRPLPADGSLTNALMKAAASVGRTELAQKLLDQASSTKSPSPTNAISGNEIQRHAAMIKAYARERNLKSAEAVLSRLCESATTALSPLIYNCFLDACIQCGDMARATSHFEEMKRLGSIDVVSFNTMIKVHLTQGHVSASRALMAEMAERGFQANKVTFNELLHARVLAKDLRGMWGVIEEMQQAGVRANPVTCSILLKSLSIEATANDVRRIIALTEEMEGEMDEVLFSSIIEACIRIRQLNLLSEVMRRYRHKGSFVTLSAPTYGSMIKAYGQAGDIERVRELWQEMKELGVKPTSITIGCLTEALVMNNHTDEAWELLQKLLGNEDLRGCINTVIYSTVLKGFALTKRMDRVFAVYDEMRAKGVPCNTITYNTLLDACAKSCTMARGAQLLEDMAQSGVEPDIITYSTFIKGYCTEGDVDRAFHILSEMKRDNKFTPDEIMYNSILDGCAKQHRVDDALRILEEMRSTGVCPSNFTLSILVKLLGHARRLNQAFTMVEDLSQQNNFRPNVQVYTCLVQACVLNRRLEKALSLHETMVGENGCRTDEKFYAVLARGCLQLHQPLKAAEVVRAAYQLPGHSLGTPTKRYAPVGLEARALGEVVVKLQSGGSEERSALNRLAADLKDSRGIDLHEMSRIGAVAGGGGGGRRRDGPANAAGSRRGGGGAGRLN